MISKYTKKQASEDIKELFNDTFISIDDVQEALNDTDPKFIDMQRNMSVSHLYALWERYFKQSNGICLRLIRTKYKSTKKCPNNFASLWFRQSSDFKNLTSNFFNNIQNFNSNDQGAKGIFNYSKQILDTTDAWNRRDLDLSIDLDALAITFSNVNKKVVHFNASIFEFESTSQYQQIDFSKIDELLNRRNAVAHNGYSRNLGERELKSLLDYEKSLVEGYNSLIIHWIKKFKMR